MSELGRALDFVHGLAEAAVTTVVRDGSLLQVRPRLADRACKEGVRAGRICRRPRVGQAAAPGDAPAFDRERCPGSGAGGSRVMRHRYMVHRGAPLTGAAAREADIVAVEPPRRELILAEQWGTRTVADQVLTFERRLGAAAGSDRWFAAPTAGPVTSCCRVLAAGGVGQIEDVGTAPAARRRGLARAVVCAAVAASRSAGHELTFLNCDADGWVADFYATLGFEPVGLVYNFHRA